MSVDALGRSVSRSRRRPLKRLDAEQPRHRGSVSSQPRVLRGVGDSPVQDSVGMPIKQDGPTPTSATAQRTGSSIRAQQQPILATAQARTGRSTTAGAGTQPSVPSQVTRPSLDAVRDRARSPPVAARAPEPLRRALHQSALRSHRPNGGSSGGWSGHGLRQRNASPARSGWRPTGLAGGSRTAAGLVEGLGTASRHSIYDISSVQRH